MALVTIQRSPSPSNTPESTCSEVGDGLTSQADNNSSVRSPLRAHSFSESYFAVKGAALILPQSECPRTVTRGAHGGDIQTHLQSMFYLLRPPDTIKVAVKLESVSPTRNRYMAVVSTVGRQDTEESVILGIDIETDKATIGLVLPIWGATSITLDGDGGFKVSSNERLHIFKPVSVQAMWSALQSVIKARDTATHYSYYSGGLTHTWVQYYEVHITSDQPALNEWNTMEDIESHRPSDLTPQESLEKVAMEKLIKIKLKEIMLTVDLEEVTSKCLRTRLEDEMGMGLKDMRHFIDEEMIVIMQQMDSPSEIFPFLFLGSEWNASNLDELQQNGVNHILNVTREIDNFFPGLFDYSNIRVYDIETAELLKHWDNTYRFIKKAESMNSKVLVHCKMGVSRSASSVIAFAMKEYGWSLQEAYDYVKKKRSCIRPNKGFWSQLVTYEGILDASKQRNNKLWRSKSAGDLCTQASLERQDAAYRGLLGAPMNHADRLVDGADFRPRSWSPDDSPAPTPTNRHNGASDESSDDEMQTNYPAANDTMRDLDGPFLCWDDLDDLSSHSVDSSLVDIVQDLPSTKLSYDRHRQPLVVLLSYRAISGWEGDHATGSEDSKDLIEEGHFEELVAEECPGKVQRGFYDVQMLTADLLGPETLCEDEEIPPNYINYYLHPDYKMDLLFEQQRKRRKIAQSLRLSQQLLDYPELLEDTTNIAESNKPQVPLTAPQVTKLRADNSWIKEIPLTSLDLDKIPEPAYEEDEEGEEEDAGSVIPRSSCSPQEQPATVTLPAAALKPLEVFPVGASSEPLMLETSSDTSPCIQSSPEEKRAQCSGDADDSDTSPSGSGRPPHDIGVVQHYQKEDIPWNPGTVKRHKHDLEQRLKTKSRHDDRASSSSSTLSSSSDELGSSESLDNIEIIDFGSVDRPAGLTLTLSGVEVGETSTDDPLTTSEITTASASESAASPEGDATSHAAASPEGATDRPTSIYEMEAIDVEPGVVRRTKQEIEKRGSISSQEFDAELKTVQRSASLKEDKLHSKKDRTSERRRTCTPVLRTGSTEKAPHDGPGCTVLHVGLETIQIVEGKVKKQKRVIESRTSKSEGEVSDAVTSPETAPDTSPVLEVLSKQQPSLSPPGLSPHGLSPHGLSSPPLSSEASSERDIPQGAVWKHKQELESRFRTSAGLKELSPPADSCCTGCTRISPDNPMEEMKTLLRKSPTMACADGTWCEGEAAGSECEKSLLKVDKSSTAKLFVSSSGKVGVSVVGTSDQHHNRTARSSSSTDKESPLSAVSIQKLSEGTEMEIEQKAEFKMSAYAKENIPWNLGTVRQQTEAIEKVNTAGAGDSRRGSSKLPTTTWCEGDLPTSPPGEGVVFERGLQRASSCKSFSTAGSGPEACLVGRSASLKNGTHHTRTELRVSLSKPANAQVHISQKDIVIAKVSVSSQDMSSASTTSLGVTSKIGPTVALAREAELERWSSKKEVLIVETVKAVVGSGRCSVSTTKGDDLSEATAATDKLVKPVMKPIEEKTVRDLVGIFDSGKSNDKKSDGQIEDSKVASSKKTFAASPVDAVTPTPPQELETLHRNKSITIDSRLRTEKIHLDRTISLPIYEPSAQNCSAGASAVGSSPDYTPSAVDKRPTPATNPGGSLLTHRIPMSTHREPDPEGVPRKSRKLHGKSHPLTKLALAGQTP